MKITKLVLAFFITILTTPHFAYMMDREETDITSFKIESIEDLVKNLLTNPSIRKSLFYCLSNEQNQQEIKNELNSSGDNVLKKNSSSIHTR